MYLTEFFRMILIIAFHIIIYSLAIPFARTENTMNWSSNLLTNKEKKYCLIALIIFFISLILFISFYTYPVYYARGEREIYFIEKIAETIGILSSWAFIFYLFYFLYKRYTYKKTHEYILELEKIVKRMIVFLFLGYNFAPHVTSIFNIMVSRAGSR